MELPLNGNNLGAFTQGDAVPTARSTFEKSKAPVVRAFFMGDQKMSNVAVHQPGALSVQAEEDMILVLQNSLYPGADKGSVRMVLGYCQASGLDPMQKPVHIVPMWDGKSGKMRDVVMPGVNLYRTQAARTGKFAGMTEPEYGPMIEATLGGQPIQYPEWCRVTAKKLMDNGMVAEFTVCEYWIENYAVKGGKEKSIAPNAMWAKRPRGQIAKCAEAQALRKAFPECASAPTAEEMEGKSMGAEMYATHAAPVAATSAEPSDELLKQAKDAAKSGVAKYQEFWTTAGKEGRHSLASYHDSFKSMAADADSARTVESEPDADFVAGLDAGAPE